MEKDEQILKCKYCGGRGFSNILKRAGEYVISCNNEECSTRPINHAVEWKDCLKLWNDRMK